MRLCRLGVWRGSLCIAKPCCICLTGPTRPAQRCGTTRKEVGPPLVQILAQYVQLARKRGHVVARQHTADRRELGLATESARLFGHQSPRGTVPIICPAIQGSIELSAYAMRAILAE